MQACGGALSFSPGSALSSVRMLQKASILLLYGFIVLPVLVAVSILFLRFARGAEVA